MSAFAQRRATGVDALAQGVLAGDRLLLARAISRVENGAAEAPALLEAVYPHTGRAHIVGVTGAPGTGKSTLVTALAASYRAAGLSVGVVAIDPTSPFTGGALLGDRVRMRGLSGDAGVFIRSMATRGSLGGLSKTTGDVVTLLDAAGFDRILVETVGVGQAEVEIASTAHTTLVVEAPGMGDEVQAIKAGILEIADILVVNKADRPGVERTVQALEMMLEFEAGGTRRLLHHGQVVQVTIDPGLALDEGDRWRVEVLRTVAADGTGVAELHAKVEAHRAWLASSGEIVAREQLRIAHALENILRAELNRRVAASMPKDGLNGVVEAIRQHALDPYRAARSLLEGMDRRRTGGVG
jgi:LAO/AO transport system kinase